MLSELPSNIKKIKKRGDGPSLPRGRVYPFEGARALAASTSQPSRARLPKAHSVERTAWRHSIWWERDSVGQAEAVGVWSVPPHHLVVGVPRGGLDGLDGGGQPG